MRIYHSSIGEIKMVSFFLFLVFVTMILGLLHGSGAMECHWIWCWTPIWILPAIVVAGLGFILAVILICLIMLVLYLAFNRIMRELHSSWGRS